jgi:Zn-dependent M28 family amino/carboxypeptidase
VLTAAEVTADPGVGIIITSAEEFGLAGARALVREQPALFAGTEVLNVDTIDDEGTLFVVTHDPGNLLASRVQERLAGLAPVRGRRLPLGIMVDGVPLATVAAGAVTIGRLSWRTLRRMHSPRDDAAGYAMVTAELLGERLAAPI